MSNLNKKLCTAEGCSNPRRARGYCKSHYMKWWKNQHREKCDVETCSDPVLAKSLCSMHYQRMRTHGDPYYEPYPHVPLDEKFWRGVEKTSSCWNWTMAKGPLGYGQIMWTENGKTRCMKAHRVSYEIHHGPIPEGLDIDHKCHNPSCVNPDHLRTATHKQNMENFSGPKKNSTTGVRGVFPTPAGNFVASVMSNRVVHYLGTYKTLEDAASAVKAKRIEIHTYNILDRTS